MSLIKVDLVKFKNIAHAKRRLARANEFAPLDAIIGAQIPGNDFAAVELQRQAIRDKYAALQTQIDEAQTKEEVNALLPQDPLE